MFMQKANISLSVNGTPYCTAANVGTPQGFGCDWKTLNWNALSYAQSHMAVIQERA
jgi:hypothetical protein